jgi:hypothetical protein
LYITVVLVRIRRGLYSLTEAARLLGQQDHHIVHLLETGWFPQVERCDGQCAFSADDVLRLAAALDLPAEQVRQVAAQMAGDTRWTRRTRAEPHRRGAAQSREARERAGQGR